MAKDPFEPAVLGMERGSSNTFGPSCFKDYLAEHSLGKFDAWSSLSIDFLSRLAPSLRSRNIMVFRLGSRPGSRGTWFGLAKALNGFSEYFLVDDDLFRDTVPRDFEPHASSTELLAYRFIPTTTETTCVNLAVASGLMAEALELDRDTPPVAPATGKSTYTFGVVPHSRLDAVWEHCNGQVEIDAVLTGRRRGRDVVIVVEAKWVKPSVSSQNTNSPMPLLRSRRRCHRTSRSSPCI